MVLFCKKITRKQKILIQHRVAVSSVHCFFLWLLNSTLTIHTANATENNFDNHTNSVKWTTSVSSYSPVQSIAEFSNDWSEPLSDGNFAFVQGRTAVDYQSKSAAVGYGLAMRYDYLMEFSQSTVETYWQYKNEHALADNKDYPLYIKTQHNQRWGINFFTDIPLNTDKITWQITPRVNLWQGTHGLDGEVNGQINTSDTLKKMGALHDNILTANTTINYHYDSPALQEEKLQWQPKQPEGYGYSFDVAITADITDKLTISANAFDFLGKMYWQDMPMTDYQLTYDALGRPAHSLEGQLDTEDFTQGLSWRLESNASYKINNDWVINAHNQSNQLSNLTQLSASYLTNIGTDPIKISAITELQSNSFGIAIDNEYLGIKWLADNIDTNKAKRGDLSLYVNYPW